MATRVSLTVSQVRNIYRAGQQGRAISIGGRKNPWPFGAKARSRRARGYMVLDGDGLPVHTGRNLSKREALEVAKEARRAGDKGVHLVQYKD